MKCLGGCFIMLMTLAVVGCQTSQETPIKSASQNVSVTKEAVADAPLLDKPSDVEDEVTKPSTEANQDYKNEVICKAQSQPGTKFKKKVCKTTRRWAKDRAVNKEWVEDLTRRSGYGS